MPDRKHYVYMVRCKDSSLYTGWTVDIEKRLKTHNEGKGAQAAKYTKSRRPVTLAYLEEVGSKSEALKRECAIKKLTKEKKEELASQADLSKFKKNCK